MALLLGVRTTSGTVVEYDSHMGVKAVSLAAKPRLDGMQEQKTATGKFVACTLIGEPFCPCSTMGWVSHERDNNLH